MKRSAISSHLLASAVVVAGATGSLALVSAGLAAADGKPLPGDQHAPPVFVDPSQTVIHIGQNSTSYTLYGAFRLVGSTSEADRARMDVRLGKKLVAAIECEVGEQHDTINGRWRWLSCSKNELTATGAFDIDVIYIDDKTDQEYVAASLKTSIKGLKAGDTIGYAHTPDDLLAVAWATPWKEDLGFYQLPFYYWTTVSPGDGVKPRLRCTVGGERVDVDADMETESGGAVESGINTGRDKDTKFFGYYMIELEPRLHYGKRPDGNTNDQRAWLGDHPGQWTCQVRKAGKVLRELMFEVDGEGHFVKNPMQSGAHPLRLPPEEYLIDSRIPATNVELRLRPGALKKSIGYGVAWPDGPGVKEAQAAFPAAVGKD